MTGNGREMSAKQASDAVARVFVDEARRGVRGRHEHILYYARALLAEDLDVPGPIVEYLLERVEEGQPSHRPVEAENWRRDVWLAGRIHALIQTGLGRMKAAEQAITELGQAVEQRIESLIQSGVEPERAVLAAIPKLGHEHAEILRAAIRAGRNPLEAAQELTSNWEWGASNALRAYRKLYPLKR